MYLNRNRVVISIPLEHKEKFESSMNKFSPFSNYISEFKGKDSSLYYDVKIDDRQYYYYRASPRISIKKIQNVLHTMLAEAGIENSFVFYSYSKTDLSIRKNCSLYECFTSYVDDMFDCSDLYGVFDDNNEQCHRVSDIISECFHLEEIKGIDGLLSTKNISYNKAFSMADQKIENQMCLAISKLIKLVSEQYVAVKPTSVENVKENEMKPSNNEMNNFNPTTRPSCGKTHGDLKLDLHNDLTAIASQCHSAVFQQPTDFDYLIYFPVDFKTLAQYTNIEIITLKGLMGQFFNISAHVSDLIKSFSNGFIHYCFRLEDDGVSLYVSGANISAVEIAERMNSGKMVNLINIFLEGNYVGEVLKYNVTSTPYIVNLKNDEIEHSVAVIVVNHNGEVETHEYNGQISDFIRNNQHLLLLGRFIGKLYNYVSMNAQSGLHLFTKTLYKAVALSDFSSFSNMEKGQFADPRSRHATMGREFTGMKQPTNPEFDIRKMAKAQINTAAGMSYQDSDLLNTSFEQGDELPEQLNGREFNVVGVKEALRFALDDPDFSINGLLEHMYNEGHSAGGAAILAYKKGFTDAMNEFIKSTDVK